MDAPRFDSLTKRWASRRTAIGSLVFAFAGLASLDAEAKKKANRTRQRKRQRQRAEDHADAESKRRHALLGGEGKKKRKKKCKGGALKCGKACVNASTDALNCGGCGNQCGNGQACVGGACTSPSPGPSPRPGPGPVTCPSGQIRCGDQCVDPTSNENHCAGCGQVCQDELTCLDGTCGCADASDTKCGTSCPNLLSDDEHCGGCGQACQGNLTCLIGSCGCTSGVACGTSCVDTQTNSSHCGQCGQVCGAGQTCQGGQCRTTTCGANQILCNGTCVPSLGGNPCCSQADCGGPIDSSNQIYCDETQHQCRCVTNGYGICLRTTDKRGLCGACCAGGAGNLNCPGELGCHGQNFCTCPTGSSKCPGADNRCAQNPPNPDGTVDDPTTCLNAGGTSCMDCTAGGTKPFVCCWGRSCVDASGYGPNTGGSLGTFCGGCTTCPSNKLCCNDGPGTTPKCKDQANGGFCPPAGVG